jgi:CDP-paratose 2-epimerase
VACYFEALDHVDECQGEAFNIGGGQSNSLSLLELFDWLQERLGIELRYQCGPARASDQKVFVADIAKAHRWFGWQPRTHSRGGLEAMIAWVDEATDERRNT